MNITLDTYLKELLDIGLISVRTFNSLSNAGILDIKSILDFIEYKENAVLNLDTLLTLRNFGAKCQFEIKELLLPLLNKSENLISDVEYEKNTGGLHFMYKPGVSLSDILQKHWEVMVSSDEKVNKIVASKFKSYKELYRIVISKNVEQLLSIEGDSRDTTLAFRELVLLYLRMVYLDLKKSNVPTIKKISYIFNTTITFLSTRIDSAPCVPFNKNDLSEYHTSYIQIKYEKLCNSLLSTRALNVVNINFPNFIDFIEVYDQSQDIYKKTDIRGLGKNTMVELLNLSIKLKEVILHVNRLSREEGKLMHIEETFPFLSGSQIDFVFDYWRQHNAYPCFYIAYYFIRHSEKTDLNAYSLLFGFIDKYQRNHKEVAQILNMSPERIRQLVVGLKDCRKISCLKLKDWESYKNLNESTILNENSVEFLEIKEKERLNFNFHIFSRILYIVFDYEVEEISNTIIALNTKKIPDFKFNRSIKLLKNIINTKYSEDTVIPIENTVNYLPKIQQSIACDIMYYVAKEFYNCNIINKRTLLIKKNFVDLFKELYDIINEVGKPISINDLFEIFKSKHPTHKFTDPQSIKPYLYKNPFVRSIGNSARYALVNWEHVFFGNIRAMVLDILDKSPEPVHIENIFDKVQENFPKTTIRSVLSTCQSVAIPFNEGYYGLETKEYSKDFIEKTFQKRYAFATRLRMYKEFVNTYHRFPTSVGAEQESSLHRWLYNIQHDILDITEEQRQELNEMLLSYENSGYPRTAAENKFLQKCNDFKDYVNNNYALPTYNDGEELFFWIRRSKDNFVSYTDQRKAYLIELLNYLYSLGFCI